METPKLLSNRYSLEKPLGDGGMAVVYRARDLILERTVAIKILRPDYSRDPSFRERFRQEAMAAAKLTHPNIVTIHDFGIDGDQLFIVMEYVPGTNLNAILEKRGRLPVEEALLLIRQACAGIGYAHRAGLVHCDIKPHNFLITPDNRLKVADFGIARALASINPAEKSSVVWGSPQYFSPEQAAGEAPSPASDVYSLGVVMYYMLTGRLPFTATSATELARLHRSIPPIPPRQFNPAIPEELEQIILKVLSKSPSARYRTAGQLGRILDTLSSSELPPPLEPTQAAPAVSEPPVARITPKPQTAAPARGRTLPLPQQIQKAPPPAPSARQQEAVQPALDIDWISILLGLIAFIAVGGLVPFWLWVYITYNPPLP